MKISFLRMCAVWRRFRRGALRQHADHAQYLPQITLLMGRADPQASWHVRANWMLDLLDWLRHERKVSLLARNEWRRLQHQRLRFLLDWLDAHKEVRQIVQNTLRKTLREATGHELFSSTGMPRESAFFSELTERLTRFFLPRPLVQHDLSTLFTTMFPDVSDARWLLDLDERTMPRLWKLCGDDGIAHSYRQQIDEAMLYLVQMVVAVGISPAFRQRLMPNMQLLATPFMSLRRELENYLLSNTHEQGALRSVRMLLAVCQAQTDRIYAHLDKYGTSLGLIYHLERMRAQLKRINRLLDLRNAPGTEEGTNQIQAVLIDLIVAHHHRSSVRDLMRRSFSLMARKLVERAAYHGEWYIARDSKEYGGIVNAAMTGGIVASFMGLAYVAIDRFSLPDFFEGFSHTLNFAFGFLLIAILGGVFAVRQPAVLASSLAEKINPFDIAHTLPDLLERITALLRAQFAAVFGNLMALLPITATFTFCFATLWARPLMEAEKAQQVFTSLSIMGAAPLFAIVTGILLWLSSLIAGMADNWFALRRLKETIANHRRIVHAMGVVRAERFANWLERNVAGMAGGVSLALLLGMIPAVVHFFGVPFEVQHVTLSLVNLMVAIGNMEWTILSTPEFALACAGLLAVGVLNIAVAFACALTLALHARETPRHMRHMIYHALLKKMIQTPITFLLPPSSQDRRMQDEGTAELITIKKEDTADDEPTSRQH